jgi:hypothetical protein
MPFPLSMSARRDQCGAPLHVQESVVSRRHQHDRRGGGAFPRRGFRAVACAETNPLLIGIWDAICSGAGILRATVIQSRQAELYDLERSAEFADGRAARHPLGPQGRDARDAMRYLPWIEPAEPGRYAEFQGQPAAAVYKELRDFKAGARINVVMNPFAAKLSEQDMLDLAAYYSHLARQARLASRPGRDRAADHGPWRADA